MYRAESIVPVDLIKADINAYVVAKFSGNKVQTSVVSSLNPEWNELLQIGTGVPNKSKYLYLELWNYNRIIGDDLVGVLKLPFTAICEGELVGTPQWGHLYGPPLAGKDISPHNFASKMQIYGQDLGSHYRGRLLFKVTGKKYTHGRNSKTPITFHFPFKPTPVVPLKSYTLQVDAVEGFHLPRRQ